MTTRPMLCGKLLFHLLYFLPVMLSAQTEFRTDGMKIVLSREGRLSSIYDLARGVEYLAPGTDSPLVRVSVNGKWESPAGADFSQMPDDSRAGELVLHFDESGVKLRIMTRTSGTHVRFEITRAEPAGKVDRVSWGPYGLDIQGTVGEIIGVVRNSEFAVGLQVLNPKTLGGTPLNEEGSDPSRSATAVGTGFGCTLQAWSMDRTKPRNIDVWWGQFPSMPVPPVEGETVEGSAIALFGCPAGEVLETTGRIEVAENLPHPVIEGVWSKVSPRSGRSYLIADFSESTVDELLGYTKRANLMTLYHMNAWKSWGHYEPDTTWFPHGTEGLRQCLAKASSLGILLGAHTLTNFINTNDPYVTPVPDPRLAVTGSSPLAGDITATDTTIGVMSHTYFSNEKANWLHTVRIGDELIRYAAVSGGPPYLLTGCERGAFGTKACSHAKGAAVSKLLDHPYKVFFPNFELMKEIAANLARRFNETGLGQMDFDGHEGCLAAGQGDYGMELFADIFYRNLDHPVLNGTSNSEPYYWHINTYCNWGEPWNGGFTESMQQYRLDNQGLLERNYLPNMLGWYLLTDSTTLPEMEWMLARSAGYNAGFAMATSLESLRKNPRTGELLDAIREWETCRGEKLFPAELKEELKNPKREFHLEKVSDGEWNLYLLPGKGTGSVSSLPGGSDNPVRISEKK